MVWVVFAIAAAFVVSALARSRSRSRSRDDDRAPGRSPRRAAARTPRRAATESFTEAKVRRVIDGDTVIVSGSRGETRIRLDSIDCPEDGQLWGDIAKYGLIKLIGGRRVRLEDHGLDRYGRTLATVYVRKADEWVDVNARMVTLGHAWVMRGYYGHLPRERRAELNRLERWAKTRKVGLWRHEDPMAPWDYRLGSVDPG